MNGQQVGIKTGLINGSSMPKKGLTNGSSHPAKSSGLINGCGRLNGTSGLINGCSRNETNPDLIKGMINGYRAKSKNPYEIVHVKNSVYFKKKSRQRKIFETISVISICGALLSLPFFVTMGIHYMERIQIDGEFTDWSDILKIGGSNYYSYDEEINEHIDIKEYAVDRTSTKLSLYLQTDDDMLYGTQEVESRYVDTIRAFIDTDDNKNTGYKIKGIGADYSVKIDGYNNTIYKSSIDVYTGEDGKKWNWHTYRDVNSAVQGNQIEFYFHSYIVKQDVAPKIIFVSQDSNQNMDMSYVFDSDGRNLNDEVKSVYMGEKETESMITIDGEFNDWEDVRSVKHETTFGKIGINEHRHLRENTIDTSSFYVKTDDYMFTGCIPEENREIIDESETETIQEETPVENPSQNKNMPSKQIIDYNEGNDELIMEMGEFDRIFVKGIYNEIYLSEHQNLIEGEWVKVKDVSSALNGNLFETQALEIMNNYNTITIKISDWRGNFNFVQERIVYYSKGMSTQGIGDQTNAEIGNSTANDGTAYGFQRKCFRDSNDYWWAMYYDGTNTVIERSDNTAGSSWTGTLYGICSNNGEPSLWYDESNEKVWIAFVDGYDIIVRNATLSGSPTTLSFGTNSTALDGSASDDDYSRPFISLSSSGYVWVSAKYEGSSNNKYIHAVSSSDIGNYPEGWDASTEISSADTSEIANSNILPLDSDKMYCVWRQNGDMYGNIYDSGWDTEVSIGTCANQEGKGISAVVDSNYYVNLVYVDGSGNLQFRQRTSSWQSPVDIDTTDSITYPSVSIDPNNDNMSVFFGKGNDIYKSDSFDNGENWTTPYEVVSDISSMKFLSAAYYFKNDYTMFMWQSGTGSPYSINGECAQIPEITNEILRIIIIPIGIVLVIGLCRLKRKK